jgi:hypothetical protein
MPENEGTWRYATEQGGLRGPDLPEACPWGNTLLAFRFVGGGSAWESNPNQPFPVTHDDARRSLIREELKLVPLHTVSAGS